METKDVTDPLYVEPKRDTITAGTVETTTAAIENIQPGICLKCKKSMGRGNLGGAMGNLEVFYCNTCRVAEPLPNL